MQWGEASKLIMDISATKKNRFIYRVVFALIISTASTALLMPSHTVYAATCTPSTAFKMLVKTDIPGSTTDTQFRIPTTGSGYSYRVDINGNDNWSDTVGSWNEATNRTGAVTIDFGAPGTYTISICGNFPRVIFNNTGDKDKLLAITQWGDNQWTSMESAFYGAANLDVTATDVPNLSTVTSTSGMFRGAASLVGNSSFNNWDTSHLTATAYMFSNATNFNQPIGNWDVSSVTTMNYMFQYTALFNQDISSWDVSRAITIIGMFYGAASFNQPLNSWNTSSMTNISNVFRYGIFNQPLDNWDTSRVTTMNGLFYGTPFNQNINNWNTSSLLSLSHTFEYNTSFNQPLDNWDVSHVTNISRLFNGASAFNQPLTSWNTSSVMNMSDMFKDATSFNQSLGSWDISGVTSMSNMLSRSALSRNNYDTTLTSWNAQTLQSDVTLGAHGLQYCNAELQRQNIITTYNWTIEGDGYDCTVPPTTDPSDPDDLDPITSNNSQVPGVPNTGVSQLDTTDCWLIAVSLVVGGAIGTKLSVPRRR